MKKLTIILTFLSIVCTSGYTQDAGGKIPDADGNFLILRTYKRNSGIIQKAKIVTSDGNKILQTIPLENTKAKNTGENLTTLVKTMNNIKDKGYVLIESTGGSISPNNNLITDYIFQKKEGK